MAHVFQYGSNTSIARLNGPYRLAGRARLLGPAVTEQEYELGFTVWSEDEECAAADLVPGSGRRIWGALYDIPDELVFRGRCPPGTTCLDHIESEGTSYGRVEIEVRRPGGARQRALTYLVLEPRTGLCTAESYTRHILQGLTELGAPRDYLEYVRARIAAHLDT